MAAEALTAGLADEVKYTATIARASGEVVQLNNGLAGVVQGLNARAIGDEVAVKTRGRATVAKTASINLLEGAQVFWDRSANTATFERAAGDFYLGYAAKDSLAAATEVEVVLNEKPAYLIDFDGSPGGDVLWTEEATDGLGVTAATTQQPTTLSFDAVAEVAQAALFVASAEHKIQIADGFIAEFDIAIYNIGDDAALDINIGVANGSHATDADAITESVFFHLDGSALDILAESDDGTTEVAATDTTVDAVDDTSMKLTIDARDPADVQLYIDAVNVLPASVFKINAATGPLFPIVHLEKTSNDTEADVRVKSIRVRTTDEA